MIFFDMINSAREYMRITARFNAFILLLSWALLCGLEPQDSLAQSERSFLVSLAPEAVSKPVSGRLLVFLSQQSPKPIEGPNWFHPEPFFGLDVLGFEPGTTRLIDGQAKAFPTALNEIPAGDYFVQAILDQDHDFASPASGPGNIYGGAIKVRIGPKEQQNVSLTLDRVVPPLRLEDSPWLKFVEIESPTLSEFHQRKIIERAAVVLPAGYEENPNQRYPVIYEITGFGATLKDIQRQFSNAPHDPAPDRQPFIRVMLTGECGWGHHVYANSDNNGPRGDAFIDELIPHIDQSFRTIAQPYARLLTGHSSGGWSTLWLQINYPDTFGGVWSTAPDPVDFRNFQQINLYRGNSNMFVDSAGAARPLARRGKQPIVMYEQFSRMEDVLGPGGQLRSFEAVFSPRGQDGLPKRAWNRKTGVIDRDVTETWKRYDMSELISKNAEKLRPKLSGKIRIFMGQLDTFYLEGAIPLFKQCLADANIDATIEMFPDRDHFNLRTPKLKSRIRAEMMQAFRNQGNSQTR